MVVDTINHFSSWVCITMLIFIVIVTSIALIFCSFCGMGVKSQSATHIVQSSRQNDLVSHREWGPDWSSMVNKDEERLTVHRPRDHAIRLSHRPISTVKPNSISAGNIHTHLPRSCHGSPNSQQFINQTRIGDPVAKSNANSQHKLYPRPVNDVTSPLTAESQLFYGIGNSSEDLNSERDTVHGKVNPAFENTTPVKKEPVFQPVYAHTEEERSAMLKRMRTYDNSLVSDQNQFMNNHRYRSDSQKYFWNSSTRSSEENVGHSISAPTHFPLLLSRGASIRTVCKNGEFKNVLVNQHGERIHPHSGYPDIIPGKYMHPKSYFNSPNLVTRQLSDASDYSNASHYAQGHDRISDFDKSRTRSIKNNDSMLLARTNRSSRYRSRRREKQHIDNQFQFPVKEGQLQTNYPPTENSTLSSRQTTMDYGSNSNYFDNDRRIHSPSNSQWNSIYHWGNPISGNYSKPHNSPEIRNPTVNKINSHIYEYDEMPKETYDRNPVSPRKKNHGRESDTNRMIPSRNRAMGVSGQTTDRFYEYAKEIKPPATSSCSPMQKHRGNNNYNFSSASNQQVDRASSGLASNNSPNRRASPTLIEEDDYAEPLDSILSPIKLNMSPSLQQNKNTKPLIEDVVPEAPPSHIYVLPWTSL